ncbi:hypothetical protein KJ885_05500, partial [Patescibacteria group bacterium]|nr:hypothetical protein [Patescibacteria group bacterium]
RHKDFWEIICQFDRGETKALEVHREIAEYLESDMNYAEFVEIWQGMFGVDERFLDLISRMEGVRKGIISDLCTIHFEEASMLILMDIFEVKFFSFMEGLLKRDNGGELFARAIKLSGAEAENIVFVDDLKINVELAAAHGIRAFHYQNNFDAFVRFLKSLGVKIKPQ